MLAVSAAAAQLKKFYDKKTPPSERLASKPIRTALIKQNSQKAKKPNSQKAKQPNSQTAKQPNSQKNQRQKPKYPLKF
jgi:uncharacterized protein YlaI